MTETFIEFVQGSGVLMLLVGFVLATALAVYWIRKGG